MIHEIQMTTTAVRNGLTLCNTLIIISVLQERMDEGHGKGWKTKTGCHKEQDSEPEDE